MSGPLLACVVPFLVCVTPVPKELHQKDQSLEDIGLRQTVLRRYEARLAGLRSARPLIADHIELGDRCDDGFLGQTSALPTEAHPGLTCRSSMPL
jgi:hypothetical protein